MIISGEAELRMYAHTYVCIHFSAHLHLSLHVHAYLSADGVQKRVVMNKKRTINGPCCWYGNLNFSTWKH